MAFLSLRSFGIQRLLPALSCLGSLPRVYHTPASSTFTVALVGAPNVGKSTLYNALVKESTRHPQRRKSEQAIVLPTPGVTRDRREGLGALGDLRFRVVDTAGVEDLALIAGDPLKKCMGEQATRALTQADVALLLLDGRMGVAESDRHVAQWVRRTGVPALLIANKCERAAGASSEFLEDSRALGFGEPILLSAVHREGFSMLHDALCPLHDIAMETRNKYGETNHEETIQLAVMGRPNVGKSTLVNRLLGDERVIVGPQPGITRDSIATEWLYDSHRIRLVDTAGIRRKSVVHDPLEKLTVRGALQTLKFAHVVAVLFDMTHQDIAPQDLSIAARVIEEGRALVLVANKWDLVNDEKTTSCLLSDRVNQALHQAKGVDILKVSALKGTGVDGFMHAILQAWERWNIRVTTARLNRWLDEIVAFRPPPSKRGRAARLKYMTQVKARPPTFALFYNAPFELPSSYVTFLTNALRKEFDLWGVPMRITLRRKPSHTTPS